MGDHFVLFIKPDKGVPVSLEPILLTEFYEKKPFEGSDLYADVSWRTTLHKQVEIPPELWLVTSDRLYSFDVYPYSGGFIASQQFIDLLTDFQIDNYERRNIKVVSKRKEFIKAKNYSFIKFHNGIDAIDLERSKLDRDKQGGYIKKFHEIYLTNDHKPDLFVINGLVLTNRLFCSHRFKSRAEELKINGIAYIPAKEAGNYKEYR